MYIALNQPVVPEYKAVIKLKPVTEPEMKVINRYKKGSWSWLFWAEAVWVLFLIILYITHHVS